MWLSTHSPTAPTKRGGSQRKAEQMTIAQVEITNDTDKDDMLEITMRGKPADLIKALVNGLDRASLVQIQEALSEELARRTSERS